MRVMYEAPPPAAATDLQHLLAGEIHLASRQVVELNAESVGLVGRRQGQGHRRIFLVTKIEENHVIADLAGAERQNIFRCQFSDQRRRLQAVFESHGEEYGTKSASY